MAFPHQDDIFTSHQTRKSFWDTDDPLGRTWRKTLLEVLADGEAHIREGRFQRSMALLAGASSVLAGLEVSYEHYRGSYGQKVMWTPVVLSGAMTGGRHLGFLQQVGRPHVLRWTSAVTLLDSVVGFFFHVRGIARKPGGWRLADDEYRHGAADLCPAAVRRERLSWADRLVSSTGGIA